MKLDVAKLPVSKEFVNQEMVVFDAEKYICHRPLIEVLDCQVTLKAQRFEEFIYVNISIVSKVMLECSYSLKHFETTLKGNDELHFAPYKDEEDDDIIEYKGNVIDLDDYIFNLLSACVPLSPKAPGAKIATEGKGYRVISDKELLKEKDEKGNSQFDVLKDLEF